MSTYYLTLTPRDPLIARDGRPFGIGQGNRMRGLSWLLPSVVAGSFRTALVKSGAGDFSGNVPDRLKEIAVAGVFPVTNGETLYLPAPLDCVWDTANDKVFRTQPVPLAEGEGVDFPDEGVSLQPVRLTARQAAQDFKPTPPPAWWPLPKYVEWLTRPETERPSSWFDDSFLGAPLRQMRDHVCLDPARGAAAESLLFATSNLHVSHLPRFGRADRDEPMRLERDFAEVTLAVRVRDVDPDLDNVSQMKLWHPLGGERRLVHWQHDGNENLRRCPDAVREALREATHVRLLLATPAIFEHGWKPGWLDQQLQGSPPNAAVTLKLVGVCSGRWRAVSGWSLAHPRGPKPIRRMVPAGSVYFFEVVDGPAEQLAELWLEPVSDDRQECLDGFGLAIWGTWQPDRGGD